LPEDLKAFYAAHVDGFDARYNVRLNNSSNDPFAVRMLGHIHVNGVNELKRLQFTRFRLRRTHFAAAIEDEEEKDAGELEHRRCDSSDGDGSDDATGSDQEEEEAHDEDADEPAQSSLSAGPPPALPAASFPQAFDLDSSCPAGHVVLLYRRPTDAKRPRVYFTDLSGTSYLLARSFRAYWRQLLLHMGLPYWHYVCSPVGMPQETQQWMRFLSPKRLDIDRTRATSRPPSSTERARKKRTEQQQQLQQGQPVLLQQQQQAPSAAVSVTVVAKPSSAAARPRSAAVQQRAAAQRSVSQRAAVAAGSRPASGSLSAVPARRTAAVGAAAVPVYEAFVVQEVPTSQLGGLSLRGPSLAAAVALGGSLSSGGTGGTGGGGAYPAQVPHRRSVLRGSDGESDG
jgi:hypothetical protein